MKYSLLSLFCILSIYCLAACSDGVNVSVSEDQSTPVILDAPAELVSLQDITIGPPNINRMWQFKIDYLAAENTMVKKGDLVVSFDGDRLRDDLIEKKSERDAANKEAEKRELKDKAITQDLVLAEAEAKMKNQIAQRKVEITDESRSEIERKKQMAEFEITKVVYAQSKQKLAQHMQRMKINKEVQQARVSKLEARVKNIQDSIRKLAIKAPKDGMVVYRDWNDSKPAVGETVYMGRPLINIPSLDKIAVKVEFDESDSSKVRVGQNVKVLLDAHPERPFAGQVISLGQAYRNKSQHNLKVVFDAWVELDVQDESIMRPGMKASVQIVKEQGS